MATDWRLYALGSALFAGLTAIFGKVGVSEMNSDLATFFRTIVILVVSAGIITLKSEWQKPESLSNRGMTFLVLSGIATGFSWLCYYRALQLGPASKVAPVDKLSVILVVSLRGPVSRRDADLEGRSWALFVGFGVVLMAL